MGRVWFQPEAPAGWWCSDRCFAAHLDARYYFGGIHRPWVRKQPAPLPVHFQLERRHSSSRHLFARGLVKCLHSLCLGQCSMCMPVERRVTTQVDYLAWVFTKPRCAHLREAKPFTFSDGTTIRMCPDCTEFDGHRWQAFRMNRPVEKKPWDGVSDRRSPHVYETAWMSEEWVKLTTAINTANKPRSTQPEKIAALQKRLASTSHLNLGWGKDKTVTYRGWGFEWDSTEPAPKLIVKKKQTHKLNPHQVWYWPEMKLKCFEHCWYSPYWPEKTTWEPEERPTPVVVTGDVPRTPLCGLRDGKHFERLHKNWCAKCKAYLAIEHDCKPPVLVVQRWCLKCLRYGVHKCKGLRLVPHSWCWRHRRFLPVKHGCKKSLRWYDLLAEQRSATDERL
jgi:hypothetical protein